MEHPTGYDLNAAVANWRQELAGQAELTAEVRRELETHLCDAIAGFQQRGLSAEEAFWLARRRIGQPLKLAEEFEKADPVTVWRGRIFWMWLAVFLASTLGSMVHSVANAFMPVINIGAPNMMFEFVVQATLILLVSLVPIAIGVALARGKGVAFFTKLTALLESRRRLAWAGFLCIALSCAIRITTQSLFYQRYNHNPKYNLVIWQVLASAVYPLIMVLLLVWLLPAQGQKNPART